MVGISFFQIGLTRLVSSPSHPHEGFTYKAITYWKPSLFSTGKVSLILPKLREHVTQCGGTVHKENTVD